MIFPKSYSNNLVILGNLDNFQYTNRSDICEHRFGFTFGLLSSVLGRFSVLLYAQTDVSRCIAKRRRFSQIHDGEEARETFTGDGEFGTAEKPRRVKTTRWRTRLRPKAHHRLRGLLHRDPRSLNGGVQSQIR